VTLNSTFTKY